MESLGLQEHTKPNEEGKLPVEPSEKTRNPVPRRPRMKEVSSRFMSPVSSSISTSTTATPKCPLPKPSISTEFQSKRSQSAHRRNPNSHMMTSSEAYNSDPESPGSADESFDLPLRSNSNTIHMSTTPFVFQSKVNLQQKRPEKLFKENGEQFNFRRLLDRGNLNSKKGGTRIFARPDTPTVMGREYKTPKSILGSQNIQSSISNGVSSAGNTNAARLVMSSVLAAKRNGAQETGLDHGNSTIAVGSSNSATIEGGSVEISNENEITSDGCESQTGIISSHGGLCDSPPIPVQRSRTRHISRSSMPEVDLLPTMSARLMADQSCDAGNQVDDSCRASAASPCYRSLNSALSNCQESSSPTKTAISKFNPNPKKTGVFCLPPHPSSMRVGTNNSNFPAIKLGADVKRGTKASNHQEDAHSMRILYNRYLQWRFANARAESSMNAQRIAAERSLYALAVKLSELQSSVISKGIDLTRLKMERNLYTILEDQMPYLDEWTHLEGSYSTSLSEVVKALQDATLRLPVTGNVRVDCRELSKTLNSAADVMEALSTHVRRFLPEAENTDSMLSALAGVVSTERALIEECGDLLSKAQTLQITECSLRAQLIQLNSSSYRQPKGD